MTEQNKPHPMQQILSQCAMDAMMYGMGIICVRNLGNDEIDISRVDEKDWKEFADAINWNLERKIKK